jgi:toxin YhaV
LSIRPIVINDWRIYAHPLFLDQFETLLTKVEGLRQQDPRTYKLKKSTKLLAAIVKLAFAEIPQDPTQSKYRQGKTLGDDYKHWFRAKFFQQYRLFFRYHLKSKIIVYAWVNDDNSKRAYGSKTDAYSIFQKMLNSGNPPDRWDDLLQEAKNEIERLEKAATQQI